MAPPPWVRWLAGPLYSSKGLPEDEIDRALAQWCRVPGPTTLNVPRPKIPAKNFKEITNLLEMLEQQQSRYKNWQYRPRIYTVLRAIGCLEAMPTFVEDNIYDLHLPLDAQNLPGVLGLHKQAFLRIQDQVLTTASCIEGGNHGQHLNLGEPGDNHFRTLGRLGSGGFGEVDRVLSRLTMQVYARKRMIRRGGVQQSQELFRTYTREIGALKRLKHHHLVQVVGTYTDSLYFAFLMKPVADGNLAHFLGDAASAPRLLPDLRSFFGCLASTIAYLHRERIHHMDLKLTNILLYKGKIRVTDFGTAHDSSLSGRSSTQTPIARTELYTPPELGRNPRASRNAATDMWSLGVVYLEMLSVLRGKTVEKFRKHLRTNGSQQPYVYCNPAATSSWTEILRTYTSGTEIDNEPLMWVADLTAEVPSNRPSAKGLLQQILMSPYADQWRRPCCADPDGEGLLDDTIEVEIDDDDGSQNLANFSTLSAEQSPLYNTSTARAGSILNWQSNVEPATPSIVPGAWTDDYETSNATACRWDLQDGASKERTTLAQQWQEVVDEADTADVAWEFTEDRTEEVQESYEDPQSSLEQRLRVFDFLDAPAPDYHDQKGELGDYDGDDAFEFDIDASSEDSTLTARTVHVDAYEDVDVDVARIINSEYQQNGRRNSDKSFEIQESVLKEANKKTTNAPAHHLSAIYKPPYVSDDLDLTLQHNSRPNPPRPLSDPSSEAHSNISPMEEPAKSTGSSNLVSTAVQQASNNSSNRPGSSTSYHISFASPQNSSSVETQSKKLTGAIHKPRSSWGPISSGSDTHMSSKFFLPTTDPCAGIYSAEPDSLSDVQEEPVPIHDADTNSSNTSGLSEGSITAVGSDSLSSAARQIPPSPQPSSPIPPAPRPKTGPQRTLTAKNLDALVQQQLQHEPAPPFIVTGAMAGLSEPTISASKYIEEVYRAESEAATSMMSQKTQKMVGGSAKLVKWLDHDQNWLLHFAKQGKAGAVREALLKGCNPGKPGKPRPGPLLAAINGRTDMHNKCARALLEHGADPNVRRRGKPALHIAVEHEYFKGYCNLILMLLQNNANVDATDDSGDTALHKLLMGGYELLPKHKRDALALLAYFKADVQIGPSGTLRKPIHLAARRNDQWAVGMILDSGGNANEKDGAGQTPLAIAASSWYGKTTNDQRETVRQLVHYKADVNQGIGFPRNTLLHKAVASGDEDMARLLVTQYHADVTIENTAKQTPQQLLIDKRNEGKIGQGVYQRIEAILRLD